MKYFFTLLLCLSFSFIQAQLLDYELIGEYDIDTLQEIAVDQGVPSGFIQYNHELKVYKVTYRALDARGDTTTATGAVVIPQEIKCALPLVSYQHGTVANRTLVPSYGFDELIIGLLYATNGYILSLPDYIGLGDSPGLHPYLHARSQARVVVDQLRVAKELADTLNATYSDQLFLFGYSQGGHATMAAHRMIQEDFSDEFTVTAANPMSGPYDLSGSMEEQINDAEPYSNPSYVPYLILSYQLAYGNLYNDPVEYFVPPYDDLIPELFDGINTIGEIDAQLPDTPITMLQPTMIMDFNNNPNHPLRLALQDNDVYDWRPDSPIRLSYCEGDEQVSFLNSIRTGEQFMNAGSPNVELLNLGNLDHFSCANPALISGLFYFNSFKVADNGLAFTIIDTAGPSSATASDGSVRIEVEGGIGPVAIEWSNGDTGPVADSLNAGQHSVTITDSLGCSFSSFFVLNFTTSTKEVTSSINLFPNPSNGQLSIQLPEGYSQFQLSIHNLAGQELHQETINATGTIQRQYPKLSDGVYIVRLMHEQQTWVQRWMIRN